MTARAAVTASPATRTRTVRMCGRHHAVTGPASDAPSSISSIVRPGTLDIGEDTSRGRGPSAAQVGCGNCPRAWVPRAWRQLASVRCRDAPSGRLRPRPGGRAPPWHTILTVTPAWRACVAGYGHGDDQWSGTTGCRRTPIAHAAAVGSSVDRTAGSSVDRVVRPKAITRAPTRSRGGSRGRQVIGASLRSIARTCPTG